MVRFVIPALVMLLAFPVLAPAQQGRRLPNLSAMKHLTTKHVDKAQDIPGKETVMDYYAGPDGLIVTVYSFRGNKVAFSTHKNSDIQKTYRLFMDLNGDQVFQEVNRGAPWNLPPWSRGYR